MCSPSFVLLSMQDTAVVEGVVCAVSPESVLLYFLAEDIFPWDIACQKVPFSRGSRSSPHPPYAGPLCFQSDALEKLRVDFEMWASPRILLRVTVRFLFSAGRKVFLSGFVINFASGWFRRGWTCREVNLKGAKQ